jgi:hypothetical protein
VSLVDGLTLSSLEGVEQERTTALRRAVVLCVAVLGIKALILIAVDAHLFADGAWYLYLLLTERAPLDVNAGRHLAHIATQWPTVLAIAAGVKDVSVLSTILGAGLYLPSIAGLTIAAWVARDRPRLMTFPILSAVVTSNSSFFIVSESHLLEALFWPLLFLLVLPHPWSIGTIALTVVLAWPTLRSYESMVFFGPLLAGASAWRAFASERPLAKIAFGSLAAYFAAGTTIAAGGVLRPTNAANYQSFLSSILQYSIDDAGHVHTMALLTLSGIVLAAALPTFAKHPRMTAGALVAFAAVSACVAVAPIVDPESISLELHYRARVLNAVIPPLLGIGFLLTYWRGRHHPSGRALTVAVILSLAQLCWHSAAAREWTFYVEAFRNTVATRDGFVPFHESVVSKSLAGGHPFRAMTWHWTMPTMSVLLAPPGGVRAIIGNPIPQPWQPFDPLVPDTYPDLSRYHIDFRAYRAALEQEASR